MNHSIQYTELHTPDTAAATTFYTELFGWQPKVSETPVGPYTEISNGDGPIGGIFSRPEGGEPHWLIYVNTDDVESSVAHARKLGASILQDKQEVPEMGWYAILEDPQGAVFALWQSRE
ncbi:MAG: VOC family protein [Acidobacteriota bacterium]